MPQQLENAFGLSGVRKRNDDELPYFLLFTQENVTKLDNVLSDLPKEVGPLYLSELDTNISQLGFL